MKKLRPTDYQKTEYIKLEDMTVKDFIDVNSGCPSNHNCNNCILQLRDETELNNIKNAYRTRCIATLIFDGVLYEEGKK